MLMKPVWHILIIIDEINNSLLVFDLLSLCKHNAFLCFLVLSSSHDYSQVIDDAGHHVYADQSEAFNRIVQNVCNKVKQDNSGHQINSVSSVIETGVDVPVNAVVAN